MICLLVCLAANAADRRGDRKPRPAKEPEKRAAEKADAGKKAETEYVMKIDDKLKWIVVNVTSAGLRGRSVRARTDPPFGLPGEHARLAVFRNGKHIGFVRLIQSYMGGCVVGRLGGSTDPGDLEMGDMFRQFDIIAREKKPPVDLNSRQTRQIGKSIANLGHESYKVREEATAYLKSFGTELIPLMTEALKSSDPEVRTRARNVVDSIANRERPVEPELAKILMRRSGVHKPVEKRGFLGISMDNVEEGNKPGAQVVAIVKGTPAEEVGLRAGDIILVIDGINIQDSTDLLEIVSAKDPGTKIKMKVLRDKKTMEIDATLIRRPLKTELLRK
jgi:hypothetical protein